MWPLIVLSIYVARLLYMRNKVPQDCEEEALSSSFCVGFVSDTLSRIMNHPGIEQSQTHGSWIYHITAMPKLICFCSIALYAIALVNIDSLPARNSQHI